MPPRNMSERMFPDQPYVREEDQIRDRDEAQAAFSPSQMTLRTPQKQVAPQIQAAPKKSTVRSTIEENEEEDDEPSMPTRTNPGPTPQLAETPSLIEAPQLSSYPLKMLLETVIGMAKRSRDKLEGKKQISAGVRDEVHLELVNIVNVMKAMPLIDDNMATVKRELREVKETIVETRDGSRSDPSRVSEPPIQSDHEGPQLGLDRSHLCS